MKEFFYTLICICTAIVGFQIHHSLFCAIIDFFFAPCAWLKWAICHQVNISIIKAAFGWFFK